MLTPFYREQSEYSGQYYVSHKNEILLIKINISSDFLYTTQHYNEEVE